MAHSFLTRRGGIDWAGFTRVPGLSGETSYANVLKLQLNTTGTFLVHVSCVAADYAPSLYGAGYALDTYFFVVENGQIVHRSGFYARAGYDVSPGWYGEKTVSALNNVASVDSTGLLTITNDGAAYSFERTAQYYATYQL